MQSTWKAVSIIVSLFVTFSLQDLSAQNQKFRIVFSRSNNKTELYIMDADGRNVSQLTNSPGFHASPSCSPDGSKIAFGGGDPSNSGIFVMNANGADQKRLTDNSKSVVDKYGSPTAYDASPSWSPDGKRIAYMGMRDRNADIYVMNADGSNPKRLTSDPAYEGSPSWSPDSKRILFSSNKSNPKGGYQLHVINADGAGEKQLTTSPKTKEEPSWSPDGKMIVYAGCPENGYAICIVNADGTGEKKLTNNPEPEGSPYWSPDGKRIVFSRINEGMEELFIMNADGSQQTKLTDHSRDPRTENIRDSGVCWLKVP